jgi:hypothetical protein
VILAAALIAACLILLILGFLAPRLSVWVQQGVDRTLERAHGKAGEAPGPLEKLLRRSFGMSRKASDKATETGRQGREKMP